MNKWILLFFILSATAIKAQDKILPAEAKPFVLPGYEMLDYITGDLNGDKRPDAILLLRWPGEDTLTDDSHDRPFLLLMRQPNGKLKLEKRNDNLVMCRQCGGVFGDPYDNTEIKDNGFTISFYGGSSWRWGSQYRFDYKPAKKDWLLVKETQNSFQSGDPENTMKECIIEESELGEITVEKYTENSGSAETKWKVTAAKTFFYDNPKLGSKPRKGYLVKGDTFNALRILTNFIEVSFPNTKGEYTYGFILKKDLVKMN
jgi:hypothetical protein